MKKIIGYLIIIIINYLLISLFVFAFSLISLQNGKVYDIIWIKYVQKKIYDMTGFRNVFQHNTNDCVKFDEILIYVPKVGECEFSNPDFKTKLVDGWIRVFVLIAISSGDICGIFVGIVA